MGKTVLLKLLDLLLGTPLVHAARLIVPRKNVSEIHKILFIRPGGIGDAVLLIPAIKAIKTKYPDPQIDILAEKRNCGVFSICPEVRDINLYDRPKELWNAIRNEYDVVIDTESSY
ncbi:MAG: hypothetical protein HY786_02975 [Deltaproteobacteria bacterium]|nr:hypothetical protein [Deltaproteobacteria bacterium]